MAMMGARRGMTPGDIPPVAYLMLALVVLVCLLAVLINYLRKDDSDPGVLEAYEKIISTRSKSRR